MEGIWRERNDAIFNNRGASLRSTLMQDQHQVQASTHGKLFIKNLDPFRIDSGTQLMKFRCPPPLDFVFISVDVVVHDSGLSAGWGGVVRDHLGNFVLAFTMKLEPCNAMEDEIRALYHGLAIT